MPESELAIVLEKFHKSAKRTFTTGAAGGVAGASWGACLALVRNESMPFYAASMGTNFFLLTATYIAMEEVIVDKVGRKDIATCAGAGTATGGLYAGLAGGRYRGLQGAVAGAAVGAGIFLAQNRFEKWRRTKALERYVQKYGTLPEGMDQDSSDSVMPTSGSRAFTFPSLLPKTLKISDEEVEQRIQTRLEELRQEAAKPKEPSSHTAPPTTAK